MARTRLSLVETFAVWAMYGVVSVAIFASYSLISPAEMYHVSHRGIAGGASRLLMFFNYSLSLAALSLLGFACAKALEGPIGKAPNRRRAIVVISVVAAVLCLVTALPGVVDQSDLDAKPVNALPAFGVLLALGLAILAARSNGIGVPRPWSNRDRVRFAGIAVLIVVAMPWILADLGVYAGDIPPLGSILMSKEMPLSGEMLKAVHLGHHHGLDGTLFAIAALALGRELGSVRPIALRRALAWYLSLMLVYGLANIINDAWLEQVVKRGWTDWKAPDFLRPHASIGWGILLIGVGVAWFAVFRGENSIGERPVQV